MMPTYSEFTNDLATNLFLWGSENKPTELVDSALIRSSGSNTDELVTVSIDLTSYIEDGPVRPASD